MGLSQTANHTFLTMTSILIPSYIFSRGSFISTDDVSDTQSAISPTHLTATTDLLTWAHQAAIGMAHLEANNILHGRLRARHCLLTGNRCLKITDFGLSCALPVATATVTIPMVSNTDEARVEETATDTTSVAHEPDMALDVRWMSIETLRDQRHDSATDVWSFGVMLWEFFSLAERPYEGVSDGQLLPRLQVGHRMLRPPYASHLIFELMRECWLAEPAWRPRFKQVVSRLAELQPGDASDANSAYERANVSTVVEAPDDMLDVVPEAIAPPPPQ